jgi:hypothetical protein
MGETGDGLRGDRGQERRDPGSTFDIPAGNTKKQSPFKR